MTVPKILKSNWSIRIIAFLVFLVVCQLISQFASVIEFAPPLGVAIRFYQLWADGTFPLTLSETLETMVTGYLLAAAIAIPVGLAMARSRYIEWAIDPYITLLYAVPGVVLFPFIIIWFGATITASYAFVTIAPFFTIMLNTLYGVKNVSRSLTETGRAFGYDRFALWRKIVIPASLPNIITGLRLAVGGAILSTLVAELFVTPNGLGYLLDLYSNQFDTKSGLAVVVLVMILGYSLTEVVKFFERKARVAIGAVGVR